MSDPLSRGVGALPPHDAITTTANVASPTRGVRMAASKCMAGARRFASTSPLFWWTTTRLDRDTAVVVFAVPWMDIRVPEKQRAEPRG